MKYFFLTICTLLFFSFVPQASAQLAASGWPTSYHDMQRTNQTNALGPDQVPSTTKWRFTAKQRFRDGEGGSLRGVTIGADGRTLFLAGGMNGVYALDKMIIQNGVPKLLWQRFAETGVGASPCPPVLDDNEKWVDHAPTIGSDGTLYFSTEYGYVQIVDPVIGGSVDVGLKYKVYTCKTEQSPAIDANSMYLASWDGKFFAYKIGSGFSGPTTDPKNQTDSRIKWTYNFANGAGRYYTYGAPAIGTDGTVYFAWKGLYAFFKDPQCPTTPKSHCAAQKKWFTSINSNVERDGGVYAYYGPTIGREGNLYVTQFKDFYAFDRHGTILFKVSTTGSVTAKQPSLAPAPDNTVYFTSNDGNLYAINPTATTDATRIKWKFYMGNCRLLGNTIVDGKGIIYVNTLCDTGGKVRLYAINPNGTEKWHFNSGETDNWYEGDHKMSMDSDGTIYFNAGKHTIAALGGGIQPTQNPTITVAPTPSPTVSQNTPTPFYLRSDFGGIGGPKDGKVDIQDYNILAGEFYKVLPSYKANIIDTGLSAGKVDVQDYNAFVSDFLAYLAR